MWWFFFSLASNACFSVTSRAPTTKLYIGFSDVLKLRGVPIGFEKLMSIGFWFCNVLNFLYHLDISLVEICFIYTLKFGTGGWLSISIHSPRLKFVTGLLDSPKTKVKGVLLVRGLWYETPDSLGIPFDINQSLVFPGLS